LSARGGEGRRGELDDVEDAVAVEVHAQRIRRVDVAEITVIVWVALGAETLVG
jgi:hypothetical protein